MRRRLLKMTVMDKKIDYLLQGRPKSIGVETVIQPLPHKDFRFASPFIVLHHMPPHNYPPGSPPARIHAHPHRGFAPVTLLFQGEGYHRDSRGNRGELKAGDAQWMFAGSGLLHSEGPTNEFLQRGGTYELVQLWINVPARHKWDEPYYQQAARAAMPLLFEEEGVDLRLASGTYGPLTGPLSSFTPVTIAFGSAAGGKTLRFRAEEGYWTLLYVLEGNVTVNRDQQVGAHQLAVLSKEGTDITVTTGADTKLVYLSGEPLEEPVAAKGNFLMSTQEEIAQAEQDYAAGRFGVLEE